MSGALTNKVSVGHITAHSEGMWDGRKDIKKKNLGREGKRLIGNIDDHNNND